MTQQALAIKSANHGGIKEGDHGGVCCSCLLKSISTLKAQTRGREHCKSNGTSEHELPKPYMVIQTISIVLLHAAKNSCSLVLAGNRQLDRWCLINGMCADGRLYRCCTATGHAQWEHIVPARGRRLRASLKPIGYRVTQVGPRVSTVVYCKPRI